MWIDIELGNICKKYVGGRFSLHPPPNHNSYQFGSLDKVDMMLSDLK